MNIVSLNTALAADLLTPQGTVQSGIGKRPRDGAVDVKPLGLDGDEQADLSVHGGLSKAVYAYPSEHYEFWRGVRVQAKVAAAEDLPPGSLGENLTLAGLLEAEVCIGDVLRFANGCELAVSEPRYPCFKFNAVMGFNQASKLMVQSGWCGFYLAVRKPGMLKAGEAFTLIPGPREVGIVELFKARTRK
jgi:MOSC domain-containing protein YiiM